jgi:uncharacterized protein (DUF433 family)
MNPNTVQTEYAHIVCTPGVMGGEPRIADHRIRVRDIVAARDLRGFSPEEIAGSVYPDLTLAQVYAALAYYEDHRDEIDQAALAEPRKVAEFLKDHPALARDRRPTNETSK